MTRPDERPLPVDGPGTLVRDARRPDPQPTSPPEQPAEGERALLPATGELPRKCQNCGETVTGRLSKRSCSPKCRAESSRKRQADARAARRQAVLALLEEARRLLSDGGPSGR